MNRNERELIPHIPVRMIFDLPQCRPPSAHRRAGQTSSGGLSWGDDREDLAQIEGKPVSTERLIVQP